MYLNIVELNHIYQSYDAMPIFEDASLKIRNFDRIGLVGNNGSGKTTLVKIIMGEVPVDSGSVFLVPYCRIGYMRQVNEMSPMRL